MDIARDAPIDLIVFDGVCKLCNGFVNFVLEHDHAQHFYFCAAQSKVGSELMQVAGGGQSGDPLQDYQSVLLVKNYGSANMAILQKSDAVIEVLSSFRGLWRAWAICKVLPRPIRDWIYDRVAKNRYRMFGRYNQCQVPTKDLKTRFID